MRKITRHQVDTFDREHVAIYAEDADLKPGQLPWKYYLQLKDLSGQYNDFAKVIFQNGPLREEHANGTVLNKPANGVTVEALLAVCLDRLQEAQKSPTSCRQNALAITNIETALLWLGDRSRDRTERGVEGTSKP